MNRVINPLRQKKINILGAILTDRTYVIPEIISQLANSNKIELGNNSFRDFQYAGDAVKMAVELLEKGQFGEVYNMGIEDGIQIYELANKIGHLMGKTDVEIAQVSERVRPWEIWHLQSDNSKLYKTIERRPEVSLDEALKRRQTRLQSRRNPE